MSDPILFALGVLELAGLVGLFVLVRRGAERRAAGKPRAPRLVRIATALLGLWVVLAFPALMIAAIVNPTLQAERRHRNLVESGTPATATITHVQETGTVINRRPEVRVRLTVQPKDAPAFDSQSTWVFSVTDAQTYRVGAKVQVFFDPADRENVAVVGLAPASE